MLSAVLSAQSISQNFFGQGLWYSDFQNINSPNLPSVTEIQYLKDSGMKLLREGGHGYNFLNDNKTTAPESYPKQAGVIWPAGYVAIVDRVREMGFEPIITLPYTPTQTSLNAQVNSGVEAGMISQIDQWAKTAYDIVYQLNVVHGRNVKYFIIGNEPDNSWGLGYTGSLTSQRISAYFKDMAVRAKLADKNIQIIGPELSYFNNTTANELLNGSAVQKISGAINTSTPSYTTVTGEVLNTSSLSGKYFLDIFSIHNYSWGGTWPANNGDVSAKLRNGFAGALVNLNALVLTANNNAGRGSSSPIKTGVTEANIEFQNNSPDLYGANSFIGGQYWSELAGICLESGVELFCPWSIKEGGSSDPNLNIGFLDGTSGIRKPSYWSYSMVANNFSGTYLPDVSTNSLINSDFKAFASKDGDHISVMILSQRSGGTPRSFTIYFDGLSHVGSGNFSFNTGLTSSPYTGNIDDESTTLLIFNCSGGNPIKTYLYRKNVEAISASPPISTGSFTPITASQSGTPSCRYTSTLANNNTGALTTTGAPILGTFSNNTSIPIPDNNATGVTSNISVSGVTGNAGGQLYKISLNITHPFDGDLKLSLICPGGTAIALSTNKGSSGDNYTNTCFTTSAITAIASGTAPFTGTFIPEQALSLLNACSANGTWGLKVVDNSVGNFGNILNWSITFSNITYAWAGPNGYTSNQESPSNAVYPGIYTVNVSGGTLCGTATRTTVLHKKSAIADAGPDQDVCTSTFATIGATAVTVPTQTYLWSTPPGATVTPTNTASPSATTTGIKTISLKTTLSGGTCPARDFVKLSTVFNSAAFTYPSTTICTNTSGSILPAMSALSNKGTFTGLPVGQLDPVTGALTPSSIPIGTYTITNSVSNDCGTFSSPVNITIKSGGVSANAGSDKYNYFDCKTTLVGTSTPAATTYNWYAQGKGTSINSSTIADVYAGQTTYYIFEANNGTCSSFDEMKLTVNNFAACISPFPIIKAPAICGVPGGNGPKEYLGILTSNLQILNDTVWITGDLKITNNKTLGFTNSVIIISSGVKIEVQPGGKLNIDHSVLQSCDGTHWQGIEVNGNTNFRGQLIIRNSYLTDANIPVKTDKTVNIDIAGCLFTSGDIGISLDRNKGFSIIENEFYNFNFGIKTTRTAAGNSTIAKNTFGSVKTAVSFDGDDHSKLIIACNNFDYIDYAIKSDNTTLKNQGTTLEGAGNAFTTTSTLPTNKLRQTNGNSMTYYYDPNNPVIASEMNTAISASTGKMNCDLITSRMVNAEASNNEVQDSLNESIGDFKLYPNPNNGAMNFDYQLSDKENGIMVIYDVTGRKVSEYLLKNQDKTLSISENALIGGVYFYYVVINGKAVYNNKLIIIK